MAWSFSLMPRSSCAARGGSTAHHRRHGATPRSRRAPVGAFLLHHDELRLMAPTTSATTYSGLERQPCPLECLVPPAAGSAVGNSRRDRALAPRCCSRFPAPGHLLRRRNRHGRHVHLGTATCARRCNGPAIGTRSARRSARLTAPDHGPFSGQGSTFEARITTGIAPN